MGRTATTRRRGAFTLIELIIVIGIIVLLAGLLLQAVMKARQAGERTEVKHDISQLEAAIKNFQATYDVKYFPSGFILTSDYAQPPGNPQIAAALQESAQYYSKVWPKAFIPGQPGKTPLPPNLPSAAPNATLTIAMDGNQAMVFFLGGIGPDFPDQDPTLAPYRPVFFDNQGNQKGPGGNRTGFLISQTNPFGYQASPPAPQPGWYSPASGATARGFFDFKPDRIKDGHYVDRYGTPYIVMGAKNGNDYNAFRVYAGIIPGYKNDGGWGPGLGVSPFVGVDGKYINPNGVQIISAGRDLQFGPGSYPNPSNGRPIPYDPGVDQYSPGAVGGDDIANFGGALLGGQ
jgi:type II secretory pathway pseudopilin PulG